MGMSSPRLAGGSGLRQEPLPAGDGLVRGTWGSQGGVGDR